MSRTTIKALWPGEKQEDLKELRNAWGSGPVIWDAMCRKYLDSPLGGFLLDMEQLWPIYKNSSIPKHHRAVLMMTYDRAYVSKKDYKRAAKDIRDFLNDFPQAEARANHWPEIADLFESDPDIPAIGFHQTSVTEDPFAGEWDEEMEDYGPFDWNTTFDVYEELEKIEQATAL